MRTKQILVSIIDLVSLVVGVNAIYFMLGENGLLDEGKQGILIVLIASLAALQLCRVSVLKSISKGIK